MIEETNEIPSITNDDFDVLRVLLHNVRGISAVSTDSPRSGIGDE
jgi:hypothetical protein